MKKASCLEKIKSFLSPRKKESSTDLSADATANKSAVESPVIKLPNNPKTRDIRTILTVERRKCRRQLTELELNKKWKYKAPEQKASITAETRYKIMLITRLLRGEEIRTHDLSRELAQEGDNYGEKFTSDEMFDTYQSGDVVDTGFINACGFIEEFITRYTTNNIGVHYNHKDRDTLKDIREKYKKDLLAIQNNQNDPETADLMMSVEKRFKEDEIPDLHLKSTRLKNLAKYYQEKISLINKTRYKIIILTRILEGKGVDITKLFLELQEEENDIVDMKNATLELIEKYATDWSWIEQDALLDS